MNEQLELRSDVKLPQSNSRADFPFLILSAICTFFTLVWVLFYCHYGFDLTDESFYIVWISDPSIYSVSLTQFGFIYHPLYHLLDGNIASLRQANVLITFILAWVLSIAFVKIVLRHQFPETLSSVIISGAIATTSLVFAGNIRPTPSYNTLALQALLFAGVGLLLADKKASITSITAWFFIGIGCWLAFMAKPSTAAVLGLCLTFYLIAVGKFSIRFLMISLVTVVVLILLSALTIDGSLITFVDRLKNGLEMAGKWGAGHEFTKLLRIDLDIHRVGGNRILVIVVGTAFVLFVTFLLQREIKILQRGTSMIVVAFALLILSLACSFIYKTLDKNHFSRLVLASVPFAAILIGFTSCRYKNLFQIPLPQMALALTFLMFPHLYAFGTRCNYFLQGSKAGMFWVLASLVFLSSIVPNKKFRSSLVPFVFAVQLMTVTAIQGDIEAPYRQHGSLSENDYKIAIGKEGSSLVLSRDFGHYLAQSISVSREAGFKKGMPMIDLTGHSPGLLYAIGAKNIGQAWNMGSFPGSELVAREMLERVSCSELATAWLLIEPDGPRKISTDILSSFGANIADDFETVGTFRTAEGAGGREGRRSQYILKPCRHLEHAIAECEAARKNCLGKNLDVLIQATQ